MIKIGDIKEVNIISNTNLGDGVGRIENKPIYIKNAVSKDKLEVKITRVNKKYLQGEIVKIVKESEDRVKPLCPYFPKCGGCTFWNVNITKENEIKENYIKRLFPNVKVNTIIANNEINYRNKVTFHIHNGKLGYYQKNSNNLVIIEECLILNKEINKIKKYLETLDLTKVTEIMIRYSNNYDELLINFKGQLKDYNNLKKIKNIKSIYINNDLVYGNPTIKEKINNLEFLIGPNSFFQINTNMIANLYNSIKNFITPSSSLLDLYCGTGTIGIYLNEYFEHILGIDIVKENIENAFLNKEINKIDNISFQHQDASSIENTYFDVVIVDPPRAGLGEKTKEHLLNINSKIIIYVSCNPNTLKKDIEKLKEKYQLVEITPVNMFPKTEHIECVSLLIHK